jgi:hypothetical protein
VTLDDVLTVLAALERAGVRYAVFGGLAMAAHGLDRGTRGLDLFVDPDPDNIERLRSALRAVFDDPDIALITSEDLAGDYPAVQYGPPDVDYTIDIVSRLAEVFHFEDLEVERVRAGDVTITVVTPAHAVPDEAGHGAHAGSRRRSAPGTSVRTRRRQGRLEMAVTRYRSVEEMPNRSRPARRCRDSPRPARRRSSPVRSVTRHALHGAS